MRGPEALAAPGSTTPRATLPPAMDPPSPPRITRALVLALALLVPAASLAPAISGYLAQSPPERIFLGFRHLEVDHYQYGSFLAQARDEGRVLMENRLTGEPQTGRFVLLYLWLAGTLARASGAPDATAWLVLQYVTGVALLLVAWHVAGVFLRDSSERLCAWLLVAVGSGFDWIPWLAERAGLAAASPFARTYAEFWNWSTSGSLQLPMWGCAEIALLLLVASIASRGEHAGPMRLVAAILLPPLAWLVHPYTGLATFAIVALLPAIDALARLARADRPDFALVRSRLRVVAPVLAGALLVLAHVMWSNRDPVVAAVSKQTLWWVRWPSPVAFPVAYGLAFLLAWFGLADVLRRSGLARDLLLAWTFAVLALTFNPWLAGVKFQYLLHLPLCVLAGRGIGTMRERVPWVRRAWERPLLRLAVLACVATGSILAPFKDIRGVGSEARLFASADELSAYEFLRAQPPGIVISPVDIGPRVAWKTGHAIFAGHWFMTLDLERKAGDAARYFSPHAPPTWRAALEAKERLDYVIAGPEERAAGFDAASTGEVIFSAGPWQVARIGER